MALDQTKVVDTLEDDLLTVSRAAKRQALDITQRLFLQAAEFVAGRHPGAASLRFSAHLRELSDVTIRAMGFSDLLGRLRTIREAKAQGFEGIRADLFMRDAGVPYEKINHELPGFLKLPFMDAIEDFTSREPVLADSGQEVHDAYRRREFSVARATNIQVVRQVQRKMTQVLAEGGTQTDFIKFMRDKGKEQFSKGYLTTVFRTNLSTAQHAGRERMADDPDLSGFLIGWRYVAQVSQANKPRPNHAAMHGHIAARKAPVWYVWMPPNGYNCRCTVIEVTRFGARDMGRLQEDGTLRSDPSPNVLPDEGFRTSPRGQIY